MPRQLERGPAGKPRFGTRLDRSHPLTAGLIGCWLLNELAGPNAFDLASGRVGALSGAAARSNGLLGPAVSGDGTTTAGINTGAPYIAASGPFTYVGIANVTAWTGSGYDEIIGYGDRCTLRFENAAGGKLTGYLYNGSSWNSLGSAVGSVVLGPYYHVAYAYASSFHWLWLNGVLVDSGNTTSAMSAGSHNLWLLTDDENASRGLIGNLAAAWIYNRALTSPEVARHFAVPFEMFARPIWLRLPGSIAASVTAVAATATAAAGVATISTGATIGATAATATAAGQIPTPQGGALVGGTAATATAAAGTPGAAGTLTSAVADATAAAPLPTISTGQTVGALVAISAAAAGLPTLSLGATVTALAATATGAAPVPAVSTGLAIVSMAAAATAAAPAPIVAAIQVATVTATAAIATAQAHPPAIQTAGIVTIAAVPAVSTAGGQVPTISSGSLLLVAAAAASAGLPVAIIAVSVTIAALAALADAEGLEAIASIPCLLLAVEASADATALAASVVASTIIIRPARMRVTDRSLF